MRASRSKLRREKLRAAQDAASPIRALADQILAEVPPSCPSAPYSGPEPPSWMTCPTPVFDGAGNPTMWIDEQPVKEWEGRRGAAAYELLREDERDRLRYASQGGDPEQLWAGYQPYDPIARTNAVINHLRSRLTVQQRQQRRFTRPWNRSAPPPKKDELPEAECGWAPWSYS
ncbi:hypothetical protein [Streptomyces sp. NPDC096033]|uniref:hypothetical protein n=1 Tax=Streptomyces sp. NPDC096033 TaxID=3366071 RepID=UPI0037F8DBC5